MEEIQGVTPRFLRDPHLPERPVACAAAAESAARSLERLGIRVLSPAPEPALPEEVRTHTDMVLLPLGGNAALLSPNQTALAEALRETGFVVRFGQAPAGAYPADIPLNVLIGRDFILGNLPHADAGLLRWAEQTGRKPVSVRQGYAKCAVCPVTEDAYITDDPGIAAALRGIGKDVLEIGKGDVYLSGAHYGFFGGAAGLLAPDRLAVNGSLRTHQDGARIRAFLQKHGVRPVELRDGQLADIGGIVPILERNQNV